MESPPDHYRTAIHTGPLDERGSHQQRIATSSDVVQVPPIQGLTFLGVLLYSMPGALYSLSLKIVIICQASQDGDVYHIVESVPLSCRLHGTSIIYFLCTTDALP